jgi:Domain of unknown function (DUF4232)
MRPAAMRPSARAIRRTLAAAAVVGAAAFTVPAALASSAASASPAVAPECPASALQVWIGLPGSGAAGHTYYPLEFTNVSRHVCDLYGYPGVSAISGGHQLGSAAARNPAVARRTVRLSPAATAHAVLAVTDLGVFSPAACKPVTAQALRIYPPDQYRTDVAAFSFPACSKAGPRYLTIEPIQAGVGIPGHPSLAGT